MSEPVLPPLPDDVRRLLEAEALGPDPSAAVRARVHERLAASILALPIDAASVPAPQAPVLPDASAAASGTAASGVAASGVVAPAAVSGLAASVGALKAPLVAALVAAGAAAGAGTTIAVVKATEAPVPERVVFVEVPARQDPPPTLAPVAVSEPAAVPEPAAVQPPVREAKPARPTAPRAPPEARPQTVPTPPPPPTAPPLAQDEELAAERTLLEQARTALARGRPAQALEPLGQHATRFPGGQLAEEREALAIQALVLAERREEASARAEAFRARFPQSILLPVVEAVLAPK